MNHPTDPVAPIEGRTVNVEPLLVTKITVPREDVVDVTRRRLVEKLCAQSLKLTVLCAAAGSGKSTLMQQCHRYLERRGWQCAWLTLDDADNDVQRLSQGLQAAFSAAGVWENSPAPSSSAPVSSSVAVIANLQHQLEQGRRVVLFLDECDALVQDDALAAIRALIGTASSNFRTFVTCRSTPALGQARHRLQNALLEVDGDDLRFDLQETRALMESYLGNPIGNDDARLLCERTDGWVAGLQLACLAALEQDDGDRYLRTFDASQGHIADYLAHEVIAGLDDSEREFLFLTAALKDVNGDLCYAITGRRDSEALLADFHERRLFIKRVDGQDGRRWYRYHTLFADFLRHQWLSKEPERAQQLYRATCEWYAANGMPFEAANYARLGGQRERSIELLESIAMAAMQRGQFNVVVSWAEAISPGDWQSYPHLSIAYLWALAFSEQPRRALEMLETLRQCASGEAFISMLEHSAIVVELIVAGRSDDMEKVCREGPQALSYMARRDAFHHSALALAVAHGHLAQGDFGRARNVLFDARAVVMERGQLFGNVFFEMLEGVALGSELRLHAALAHLRRGMEMARQDGPTYSHASAVIAGFLGETLYETNDLAGARQVLKGHLPLICESGLPDAIYVAHVTMARIVLHEGDVAAAWAYLLDAETIGLRRRLRRIVNAVRWEMVRLACSQGDHDEVARLAAQIPPDTDTGGLLTPVDELVRDIAPLRMALWQGRPEGVTNALAHLKARLRPGGSRPRWLKLTILHAIALQMNGSGGAAIGEMCAALRVGLKGGAVRAFIDEGPDAAALIEDAGPSFIAGLAPHESHALQSRYEYLLGVARSVHGKGHVAPAREPLRRAPVADAVSGAKASPDRLTERELQIIACLERGLTNQALAATLQISETTVKWHLRNVFGKLGVGNRTEAISVARKLALI
ncbi:LuxR C-terminal-related transcriptional regulator [Paraburkholderia sp. HP33-1]|uniref:LuxR C-terminal-related transcriptional regulator n=1 Tax=Paraburkholderia sp. HP33-1 TaxID=2883243 RepID=UPI001F3E8801|nr:LuxR C-terminal-related transcriptional regulator [Paraburkholderia sp. HP33-1]